MTAPSRRMVPALHTEIVEALVNRWPESRPQPSLARIKALCTLLGDPQDACPVIQVAGTNGKGSTAIMIDALLRSMGLRVGRFSSPHLVDVCERISVDGEPLSTERFDEIWREIAPMVRMVDEQALDGVSMTFFEVITAMGYAAFADAPVDVAVVEVGMGGSWDATSVADARVGVVTPIGMDHTHLLGDTLAKIAGEKAGIIKKGTIAVLSAQEAEAARVLEARCLETGSLVRREGIDFGLVGRVPAVGGQMVRIDTCDGEIGDLYLPLHGAHMARNAALAVGAVEAFRDAALAPGVIEDGLAAVVAPARLEVVHDDPILVLDTAHNPPAVAATLAGIREAFPCRPLIGLVAMMRDKDIDRVMGLLAAELDEIVVTTVADDPRAVGVDEIAEVASDYFPSGRVHTAPGVEVGLRTARGLGQVAGEQATVLVIGSVHLAGKVRFLITELTDGGLQSKL